MSGNKEQPRTDVDGQRAESKERQGPLGDVIPENERDARTAGGQSAEPVESRPNVGQVKPEDYPLEERNKLTP